MLILVVPVSSGHLARRLLAGPVEVTGNGRSQIRCDGGSPLSCTIILLVQRYLCSSINSPVASACAGTSWDAADTETLGRMSYEPVDLNRGHDLNPEITEEGKT
jgi:hypothetical protein